jgi:hypothetical protein
MSNLPQYLRDRSELITPPSEGDKPVVVVPAGRRTYKRAGLGDAKKAQPKNWRDKYGKWEEAESVGPDPLSEMSSEFKVALAAGRVLP